MRLLTTMAAVICASILSGCASEQELALRDDQYCRSIGTEPGTPQYDHCRAIAEQESIDRRRARRAALLATGLALMSSGSGSSEPPQPAPTPPTLLCDSLGNGQMMCR